MASLTLRRLLSRQHELAGALNALLDSSVAVLDADNALVAGTVQGSPVSRVPLRVEDAVLGWVEGGPQAQRVAAVLMYALDAETGKRSLAQDALEKYRELTLLYDLSEKLGASLDVETVAAVAVAEARRRIKEGAGFVLLLHEGKLSPAAAEPAAPMPALGIPGGILAGISAEGRGEIVNGVERDPRCAPGEKNIGSLVVAPIKSKGRPIGVLGIAGTGQYSAADLKFLNAIASYAGPAIDNALLYQRTVRSARERERELLRQLDQLQVEVDRGRQSTQVTAITGSDYFRRLRDRAGDLRHDLEQRVAP